MMSCDESQSDDECSEPELSSFSTIGKKFINRGRWTKQEVGLIYAKEIIIKCILILTKKLLL